MTFTRRHFVAAFAGAITMFVWGGLSHMLFFKGAGFSHLPDEDAVMSELKRAVPEDGLYFFPGTDFAKHLTDEERAAWEAKFLAGPTGLIVINRSGDSPVSPTKVLVQAASHFVASVILTYVLSLLVGVSVSRRVLVAGLLGAFSALTLGVIPWNWYGFPTEFFAAQCADMVIGWSLAGAVIVSLTPRAPA